MSQHTQEDYKLYIEAREKHLDDYPRCQFKGCVSSHVRLKHLKGKEGSLLYDRKNFKSYCEKHFNQEINQI